MEVEVGSLVKRGIGSWAELAPSVAEVEGGADGVRDVVADVVELGMDCEAACMGSTVRESGNWALVVCGV